MPPGQAPTHFLCIPLAGPQLASSLAAFRHDVTSPSGAAWPRDATRPLGTIHLTLGVMNLADDRPKSTAADAQSAAVLPGEGAKVKGAVDVLNGIKLGELYERAAAATPSMPGSSPAAHGTDATNPHLTIRGLHAMKSPSKTSVLYAAPVDPQGILYRFCEQVRAAFRDQGLMMDSGRPLLLHATVVNTIYVKGRGKKGGRMVLDARAVLDNYEDHVWMEDVRLDRIAICRMGAKKVDGEEEQAYEVEAQVQF